MISFHEEKKKALRKKGAFSHRFLRVRSVHVVSIWLVVQCQPQIEARIRTLHRLELGEHDAAQLAEHLRAVRQRH